MLMTFIGHEKVVQLLIQNGADVNLKNDQGLSPLHAAAEFGIFLKSNFIIQL